MRRFVHAVQGSLPLAFSCHSVLPACGSLEVYDTVWQVGTTDMLSGCCVIGGGSWEGRVTDARATGKGIHLGFRGLYSILVAISGYISPNGVGALGLSCRRNWLDSRDSRGMASVPTAEVSTIFRRSDQHAPVAHVPEVAHFPRL
jgi:hypothetical protein